MSISKKCSGIVDCNFAELSMKGPQKCGPFQLDGRDAAMFDHFAQEHTSAGGTSIWLWHQNLGQSIRDPLYDEPIEREWQGPFKLKGFVEYIPGTPEMREEGMVVRWQGRVWLARKELEDTGTPAPLEGDVVRFWDNKFFAEHGVNAEEGVHGGYYFDVINADDDGHVQDSGHFVGIVLTVLRRTEFTPERRLDS